MTRLAYFSSLLAVTLLLFTAWGGASPLKSSSLSNPLEARAYSQFINFPRDSRRIRQLKAAAEDLSVMVHKILDVWVHQTDPRMCDSVDHLYQVLSKYFPSNGWNFVISMLDRLVSPPSLNEPGSERLRGIRINADDFQRRCDGTHFAYTDHGYDQKSRRWVRDYSMMHFCPLGLQYPNLGYRECPQSSSSHRLDRYVSYRMLVLGTLYGHEALHTQEISKDINVPYVGSRSNIMDIVETHHGQPYLLMGPQSATNLRDARGNDRYKTLINAPNYEWFIAEAYWSIYCNYQFGDARDDERH